MSTAGAPRLGLKVDVDTLRGTREGVPSLVELFRKHDVTATFLFAVGPDRTGRALGHAQRAGLVTSTGQASAMRVYGLRTMLYGTALPGPDIGRRGGDVMRAVRDVGHETGVRCYDHVRWRDGARLADAAWTEREMTRACERYTEIFKAPPRVHGAAGWQMNIHALRLTQRLGFDYCSDGRGDHPHLPVRRAELVRCPQFPTTLPTLDELIGVDGVTVDNVAAHLLETTREPRPAGHVFSLRAELEGMALAPVLEQLLLGWKAQGWRLGPVRALYESLEPMALPRCEVGNGTIPGRGGTLFVQRDEFLAGIPLGQAA